MFILPLYLPWDECSSIATSKGTVNLLYWIVQIHCIANLGNFEVTGFYFFPPVLLEDVSLILSFKISLISGIIEIPVLGSQHGFLVISQENMPCPA